jgi:hypothetical protein
MPDVRPQEEDREPTLESTNLPRISKAPRDAEVLVVVEALGVAEALGVVAPDAEISVVATTIVSIVRPLWLWARIGNRWRRWIWPN